MVTGILQAFGFFNPRNALSETREYELFVATTNSCSLSSDLFKPDHSKPFLTVTDIRNYNTFFAYTESVNIQRYASGASLEELTCLAEKALVAAGKGNPFLEENSEEVSPEEMQWNLDQVSAVKCRLAKAIQYKRNYYQNHWLGIITQFVLKCLKKWNEGCTPAIGFAEVFLIKYDTRMPAIYNPDTKDFTLSAFFPPSVPLTWIEDNLHTAGFYNYNPPYPIAIRGYLNYTQSNNRADLFLSARPI